MDEVLEDEVDPDDLWEPSPRVRPPVVHMRHDTRVRQPSRPDVEVPEVDALQTDSDQSADEEREAESNAAAAQGSSAVFSTVASGAGAEAQYPEPFSYAVDSANDCAKGEATVPEASCIRAAQSLVNVSQAGLSFVVGDGTGRQTTWASVPPGCSVRVSSDQSSATIYFNHGQGANSGAYRLMCLKGDFVGTGHCKAGILRGWDGRGLGSVRDCIEVCRSEPDCGWISYCPPSNPHCKHAAGSAYGTCSRYGHGSLCAPLNKASTHALAFDTYLVPQRSYMTFGGCDTNGDKVVTREEFMRQELQDSVSQARALVIFEELDHDMDGVLKREEFFSQGIKELGTRVGDVDALVNVFFYLDTNGDKKLTFQEVAGGIGTSQHALQEAQTFFVAADTDGNGWLSRDEFVQGSQNRQNKLTYTWQSKLGS